VGILIFLGGIALLVFTFSLAYSMFTTPPERALNLPPGEPVDLTQAGTAFVGIIIRVLLLVVMCIAASIIATRGIRLYGEGRDAVLQYRRRERQRRRLRELEDEDDVEAL
jgi:uncharacterized membrane protein